MGVIDNRVLAGNQAVEVRAVAIITEEGGKMARVRHYIDVAGMLTQLGVMPAPG